MKKPKLPEAPLIQGGCKLINFCALSAICRYLSLQGYCHKNCKINIMKCNANGCPVWHNLKESK